MKINDPQPYFAKLWKTAPTEAFPMIRDDFQTVREVADRLKVSEATVRQWIRAGDLRAIDIGKGWRIADRDFDAFLEGHATRPAEATGVAGDETGFPVDVDPSESKERKA